MKNPFWNREQRRVRALWRLVAQGLLFFVAMVVPCAVAGIVLGPVLIARSGGALAADPAALAQALVSHPLFSVLNRIVPLLAVFGSVWLAGRFLDRRRFADFGFHLGRGWWLDLAFGLGLGAVLMAGIFAVELAAGWVRITGTLQPRLAGQAFLPGILLALAGFVGVGIYEELLSRGYQLRNMAEGLNGRLLGTRGAVLVAWLVSSSVFGLLHAANPNATIVSTANLVVAGLFLGLAFVLTGELAIPIGLHITWNFFQGNVFGFPVSGGQAGATFIAIAQGGPALWTGGAFGPEAGLIGIAAIVAGSGLIVLWVRARQGRVAIFGQLSQAPQQAPVQPAEPGTYEAPS
ncbi:MAG TPA: CPBP family intramembrane metalloprotease [Anaerolineae bacterium]|nr:CPBP family intramembrane metalloprotease [Anaerolineae bacterium]HOQ98346.1 CPBP family intramembrane metalloprotease [Anaerolineae bacterium]HPL26579.1 CPBP family intramembrane metalloprotease [Anaerolineae bacterium]